MIGTLANSCKDGLFPLLAVAMLLTLAGCGSDSPFPMTQITGTVTYEDGTIIPGDRVVATFVPKADPLNKKTHPRSAFAVVDPETGELAVATTIKYGDGVIRGKHKVFIVAVDNRDRQLPHVPFPYNDSKKTPIEIDTENGPLKITIPRPKS